MLAGVAGPSNRVLINYTHPTLNVLLVLVYGMLLPELSWHIMSRRKLSVILA